MTTGRSILFVFAHPDDESHWGSGVAIHYHDQGVRTVLVTLTRGGRGTTGGLCSTEELPGLREQAYKQVGRVEVEAAAGAVVSIDGAEVTTATPAEVEPGDHAMTVKNADRTQERTFSVRAGQLIKMQFLFPEGQRSSTPPPASAAPLVTTPAPDPAQAPQTGKYWVVGTLGLGAAITAAVGFGFGVAAKHDQMRVDDFQSTMKPWCDPAMMGGCARWADWRQAAEDERSHARTANVLYVSAGALLAASAVTWLVWPRSRSSIGLALSPGVATMGVAHAF